MRVSAIIVAAGSGQRLGCGAPKAFVPLGEHPILYYSLRTLAQLPEVTEAVVALPEAMEAAARKLVYDARLEIPVKLTQGGAERQDSVRIALKLTGSETEVVIVHDAARPFAPAALFRACIEAAARAGGALAAIPAADTLKQVQGGAVVATKPRSGLYQAQTPQAFRRDILVAAHAQATRDSVAATDDAELAERLGVQVEIVEGSSLNLKITTPDDLTLARALVAGGDVLQ